MKNGAVKIKGEVKKPYGLHVHEMSAEGVQGGGGDNMRWEIVVLLTLKLGALKYFYTHFSLESHDK